MNAMYGMPDSGPRLEIRPRFASWDAAERPSQVRLEKFLSEACQVCAPQLDQLPDLLALRLDVGLPGGTPLLEHHDAGDAVQDHRLLQRADDISDSNDLHGRDAGPSPKHLRRPAGEGVAEAEGNRRPACCNLRPGRTHLLGCEVIYRGDQ
ncbi:hypothetical protein ACIBI9_19335 [Nonomuraea sp. NPDC050451]|uniref:hypothetical protein n=1 Tax=Nonomuraea sp. NPDC050451 TaxID=3364364 RepID=UPI0037A2AC4F